MKYIPVSYREAVQIKPEVCVCCGKSRERKAYILRNQDMPASKNRILIDQSNRLNCFLGKHYFMGINDVERIVRKDK